MTTYLPRIVKIDEQACHRGHKIRPRSAPSVYLDPKSVRMNETACPGGVSIEVHCAGSAGSPYFSPPDANIAIPVMNAAANSMVASRVIITLFIFIYFSSIQLLFLNLRHYERIAFTSKYSGTTRVIPFSDMLFAAQMSSRSRRRSSRRYESVSDSKALCDGP